MSRDDRRDGYKVYVGDLPRDASEAEVEKAFAYYGSVKSVWVARNPPGFAFVVMDDDRDADDAVRGLDGTSLCGVRVRVEISNGRQRPKPWMRGGPSSARAPPGPANRCYTCGGYDHFAYECRSSRHSRKSPSRSPYRSRDRSRSRSRDRYRSNSRDRYRSSSRDRGRSLSRDRYRSISREGR